MTAGGDDSAGGSGGGLLYTAWWRFAAAVHHSCSAGILLPLLQVHCTLSTTRRRNLSLGAIHNKGIGMKTILFEHKMTHVAEQFFSLPCFTACRFWHQIPLIADHIWMDYYQIVCEALTLTSALACVFALKNSEWTLGVTENLKLKQEWLKRLLPHLTSCFWSLIHDPLLFFGNVLRPAPITFSTSSRLQKWSYI